VKSLFLTLKLLERVSKNLEKQSAGPDGVPGEILKLGGVAMTANLASLLKITLNNTTIPSDRRKVILVPIYNEGD